jgi:membrane protease YdiL (CAAX protease family)
MDGLTLPFTPDPVSRPSLLPFSLRPALPFSLLVVAAAGAWGLGWLPWDGLSAVGLGAFHGALVALAFASVSSKWGTALALYTGGLILAAALTLLSPWGGLIYLLAPAALLFLVRRHPELNSLGLRRPEERQSLGLGIAVGFFLGGHLLITATQTLGYQPRLFPLGAVLSAVAYDLGANVLSAECFFRGALFGSWQRRWGFWAAAFAATGCSLVRYLLDPALPHTLEVVAGAIFYLALLNLSGCALYRRSGSLAPSALASLIFFAAYRSLR